MVNYKTFLDYIYVLLMANCCTLAKLQSQIETLTQQVARLATQPPRQPVKQCFSCNQVHIQRQCTHWQQPLYLLRCFSCVQLGHLARQCYQLNTNGASVQGSRRSAISKPYYRMCHHWQDWRILTEMMLDLSLIHQATITRLAIPQLYLVVWLFQSFWE